MTDLTSIGPGTPTHGVGSLMSRCSVFSGTGKSNGRMVTNMDLYSFYVKTEYIR